MEVAAWNGVIQQAEKTEGRSEEDHSRPEINEGILQEPEGGVWTIPFLILLVLIDTYTLAFEFYFLPLFVFEIPKVNQQKDLEPYDEVEETAEIDDEILSSKGEDGWVNCNLWVVILEEGISKFVGDKEELVVSITLEHTKVLEIIGSVSDPCKSV